MTDYDLLDAQARELLADEADALARSCNFVGLLHAAIDDINWLGIYVLRGEELVVGPFQGKPACAHIDIGSGVCGAAARTRETQRVADVHAFEGHIACDPDSRSELVVPLIAAGTLIGVLDIDSPLEHRFSAEDQHGIEKLCATFCERQTEDDLFI